MAFVVSFQNFSSWPQTCVIPSATPRNDGVMTAAQAAALKALVDGGGAVPGPFVPLAQPFFSDFQPFGEPLAQPAARIVAGSVQFVGAFNCNPAGKPGNTPIALLPSDMVPSQPRIVPITILIPQSPSTSDFASPNWIAFDDAAGSLSGTPGLILTGAAIPAGDTSPSLWFDGIVFAL